MEVVLTENPGFPAYPYWKVVVVGDRAEVAEIPCDDKATENMVFHSDLETRLRERYPQLAEHRGWVAGWLTQNGDEAILRLQVAGDEVDTNDVKWIGRAMGDWCDSSGIRRLAIADVSRRNRSARAADEDDWSL